MNILEVELQHQLLTLSGFTEGETDTSIGTGSGYGDPSGAKSRRYDPWE